MKKYIILGLILTALLVSEAEACDSNPNALNYNPLVPDSVTACVPKVYGCMLKNGTTNFNPNANVSDNSCRYQGNADPLMTFQQLWGMNGYDIEKNFITLKLGETITYRLPVYVGKEYKGLGASFTDVCPSWYPSPIPGRSACWTTIHR